MWRDRIPRSRHDSNRLIKANSANRQIYGPVAQPGYARKMSRADSAVAAHWRNGTCRAGCFRQSLAMRDGPTVSYRAGTPWHITDPRLVDRAQLEQRARFEEDPWTEQVARFISGKTKVRTSEILEELGVYPQNRKPDDLRRITKILRHKGSLHSQTKCNTVTLRSCDGKALWTARS